MSLTSYPAGVVLRMAVRPPGRFCTRMLLLIIIAFFFSGALLLEHGMEEAAVRGARRLGADLLITPREATVVTTETLSLGGAPVGSTLPAGAEAGIAAMQGVVAVAPRYLSQSAADPCCDAGDLLLVGFDPSRDQTVLSWLRSGKRLPEGKDLILVGWKVLKAPGATMRFHNHPFRVAARLEKSGNSRFDTSIFIPFDGLRAMERERSSGTSFIVPWGRPSLLLVRLAPNVDPLEVTHLLENRYPGIRVVATPGPVREQRQRMERIARSVWTIPLIAWLVALLAGGALFAFTLRERRWSLGLLLTFGWGRGMISLLFGAESFVVSLAAMAIGAVGSYPVLQLLTPVLTEAAGLPFLSEALGAAYPEVLWSGFVYAGILTVAVAVMVRQVLRHDPADLLRETRCG